MIEIAAEKIRPEGNSSLMSQKRQSVLITGAYGDIGRSLALEFARNGASLALCDVASPDKAESLLATLKQSEVKVLYRQADVTDPAALVKFVEEADTELGAIDICIGNAGVVERGNLVDLSPEAWRRTLEINLTGCFLTAQATARTMIRSKRGGHIVFISSWVQDIPRANIGAYCASKGGLKMLAKTFALELAAHNIRVNLVAPGFVDAGLTGQNLKQNPERRAVLEGQIPLGKLISAEDLARTVRVFCSEENSYVTGTTLLVDGGSSLYMQK